MELELGPAVPGEGPLVEMYKQAHADAPYPPNNEQFGLGYASGIILRQGDGEGGEPRSTKIRDALAEGDFAGLPIPGKRAAFDETGLNKYAALILTEWPGNAHTVWPKDMQAMQPVL